MASPLMQSEFPELKLLGRGKVRDNYDLGDALLIVSTDRISAFDHILPNGIPDKGKVLNQISTFWFEKTAGLVRNHLREHRAEAFPEKVRRHAEVLRGRSVVVSRLDMLPVECVVRGYLAGSGYKEYMKTGSVCGLRLPPGLKDSSRLPEPLFTPSTKAVTGHDENIDREQAAELVGTDMLAEVERVSVALYRFASEWARERGILIADTKFEFGLDADGTLVLGDEALTPDSSRFWPADEYRPGGGQPSFDKQFVRDYCETLGWDKTPPGPELPEAVVTGTRARYVEAFERLTGIPFDDYLRDPEVVLR